MPMTAKPFNFDRVFDGNGADAPAKPVKRSYSATEVQRIRAEAYAEGAASAEAQAAQAIALAVGQVASAIMSLIDNLDQETTAMRESAVDIALTAADKIAGAALKAFPLAEIERLIGECAHELPGEPRLVVRVAPGLAEDLRSRIDAIAQERGFEGRVVLVAETNIKGSDARIEWSDGGVETNAERTAETVRRRVQEHLGEGRLSRAGSNA